MEFEREKFIFGDTEIHLLHYADFSTEDYLHQLTEDELLRLQSFKHIKRQKEFIATRILRHEIFGFKHIHYNEIGAPFIPGEGFISISHANNLIGISLNKVFQTGLDLELIQEKAQRLHLKFLNETELTHLPTDNELEMTKSWSAKETLYKLSGRKEIDFKADLHLVKLQGDLWKGKIINPTETLSVDLHIFEYREYIISFNSSPIAASENGYI